jgi:hypothetical protein
VSRIEGKALRVVGMVVLLALAASVAQGAVTGVISGKVTDADTSEALAGAVVSVVNTRLQVRTGADGAFVFTNVPPGTYTVQVQVVGYAPESITGVTVTQDRETRLSVKLVSTLVEPAGANVTVIAPPVEVQPDLIAAEYTVTQADEQATLSQPNDRYQFPGLVFAQPGVVPDSTFYPHIRGARANQVGYLMDGIPITEPNANVFATNAVSIGLSRLELFTGGYPAEYGGFPGGIINEVVKTGKDMQGGIVDAGLGAGSGFGGLILERGDEGGRVNWYYGLNTWRSRFEDNLFTSEAPIVSDYIGKVVYRVGERDQVTLLAHRGYARYLFPFERMFTFDPSAGEWTAVGPDDDYGRQGNNITSIGLNHTVSPAAFWSLRLSRVSHYLGLELGDPDNLFWQYRDENMLVGQLDYQQQLGQHRIGAGLWQIGSNNDSRFSVFGTQFSPFGLLDSVSNNDTSNAQAYLEDKWATGRLLVYVGGRYDRMAYDRIVGGKASLGQASPRLGATYQLSPTLLLRGFAGTYVSFPRANLVAARYVPYAPEEPAFADAGLTWDLVYFGSFPLRPQIDREQEVGMDWKAGETTLLTATVFRRQSSQMMQRWQGVQHDAEGNIIYDEDGNATPSFDLGDFDPDAPIWFAANGTAAAKGLELKADRRMSGRTRAWLSYTYLNANATSPADNLYPYGYGFLDRTDAPALAAEYAVDWNQRHTLVFAMDHRLGRVTVHPWLVYGSGFPYGQSGLDVGGSDPAHIPNPDYNPDDPASPEELVVPQNYADPNDPSRGFISPNSLDTGANFTLSLNLAYDLAPGRQVYLQLYNLLGRDDVSSYVIYHPRTGGVIGNVADGAVYYVPFSRTPPRFFAVGIRQAF